MIATAYGVSSPDRQLLGLPNWAKDQLYSVSAKATTTDSLSEAENDDRVREMLRTMLEDRFHLRIHTETREEPGFNLEVAKGGIHLKEVPAPVPPEKPGRANASWSDARGRFVGTRVPMTELAKTLTLILHRPVTDHTGLTGYYDIDERWTAPDTTQKSNTAERVRTRGDARILPTKRYQLPLRLVHS